MDQDTHVADRANVPAAPMQPPAQSARLSPRQKAAIVVRFLLNEGVDLALDKLSADEQSRLMQQMAQMSYVDRATLAGVIDEFLGELGEIGVSFPKGIIGALEVLGSAVDPALADQLRRDASGSSDADPWDRLATMDSEVLLPLISCESVEVAAVVLSKLSVTKAAELLGKMDGARARQIAYAVSKTNNITPQAVVTIGQSLLEQIDNTPTSAFADDPIERVGAILNFSQARTREDVLEGLGETDQNFAEQVRKSIFTFENIPARITDRDIPKITKDVDAATLMTAIAAALQSGLEDAANYMLDNMSKRMAQGIRDEMGELGTIKSDVGEAAMSAVVATIRTLEGSGEIVLRTDDEAE